MARREIVLTYGEEQTAFKFTRVDRSKLYGRKERVILDEDGERCVPAYLTHDGAALVPPGGTAHIYVDEAFDTVERSDLKAVDDEGEPLEPYASTLGEPQPLTPVDPARVLDCLVTSVYELAAEELGAALKKSLDDGDLFESVYNYREGYDPDVLFLLKNDEGIFALVAKETGFEFLTREAPEADDEDEDEVDELDDDLDFSMM
ncbi:MAG: hypothetical protein VYE22_05785 [Myxococcota bacterium]|nr:hypothetical protein [Myxococcota bacterium]